MTAADPAEKAAACLREIETTDFRSYARTIIMIVIRGHLPESQVKLFGGAFYCMNIMYIQCIIRTVKSLSAGENYYDH